MPPGGERMGGGGVRAGEVVVEADWGEYVELAICTGQIAISRLRTRF